MEYMSLYRALTREGECDSGRGVQVSERQLQLDAESSGFRPNTVSVRYMQDRPVHLPPDPATSEIFQLEARPGSRENRCIQPRLVDRQGLCQSPWCLISHLSQIKRQNARVILITPLWNTQPWFPALLELSEDYPRLLPASQDLVPLPSNQEFLMTQGVPDLVAWPISGNPLHHKEFLQRLLTSSCPPGGQRLSLITAPCLPNGQIGVSNGVGIPLLDL